MAVLLAGHYTHDLLLDASGEHRALGGSSAYGAAVLHALGEPFEVAAKVGPDFLYAAQVLRPARVIAGARTTSFVDDYRGGERTQRCDAVCEAIGAADLQGAFEVGIAFGVAGEVDVPALRRLREISRLVVADAQSLLREIGPSGEVRLRPLPGGAEELLDVLKASRSEASLLDLAALRQRMTVVVTDGPRGATLLTRDSEVHVPAVPAREVDPTGAGDCFLAGFAAALSRGADAVRAARLGAVCGARAVEQVGVPRLRGADLLESS